MVLQKLVGFFSSSYGESSWKEATPLSESRFGCAAAALGNSRFAVVGGHDGTTETDSTEVYDVRTERFQDACPMNTKRLGCAAGTTTIGGGPGSESESECLFVIGGHDGNRVLDSTEIYNPRFESWRTGDFLREGRFDAASVAAGSCLYVIGGHNGKRVLGSVEVFQSAFLSHFTPPPLRIGRFQCSAVAVGQRLYVVGGANKDGPLDSVEVLDPSPPPNNSSRSRRLNTTGDAASSSWELLPSRMKTKRKGCAAVALAGCIYVLGGHDGNQTLCSAEKYDPATEAWSDLPPMQTPRFGAAAGVVGNTIYVIGGHDGSSPLGSVERFEVELPSHSPTTITEEQEANNDDTTTSSCEEEEAKRQKQQQLVDPPTEEDDDDGYSAMELRCPITGDIMVDPVVASDGHSYEREAIEEWFGRFPPNQLPRSPQTNQLVERKLFPNHNLKALCRQHYR